MYAEGPDYESLGFEHQPLVSTGTSKLEVDDFFQIAKQKQKKYFIASTVLTALSLALGGYLFSQFSTIFQKTNSSEFISPSSCSPSAFPSWFFTVTHIFMLLIPTICWIDSVKQFMTQSPAQGGSVLVFKPHFVRNTTDKNFTAPETYMQRIRSHAFAMIQASILGTVILSLIGLTGTLAMSPSSICVNSFTPLRIAYITGLAAFSALFLGVMGYMIIQHRKQVMNSIGTNTSASLDHYHPL